MKAITTFILLIFFSAFGTSPSSATVYHLEMEGEIDIVTYAFQDVVSVGDTARFSFYYDSEAHDADPSPTSGAFQHAIFGSTISFGDRVYDTTGVYRFRTSSTSLGFTAGGGIVDSRNGIVTFDLGSTDPDALFANMLPTHLDLAMFDLRNYFQFVAPSGGLAGSFSSTTITAVPLPASGLLFLGGLLAAFGWVVVQKRRTA
jgi:hypothetical protein